MIRLFLIPYLLLITLFSLPEQKAETIEADDSHLHQKNNSLFYGDHLFSGTMISLNKNRDTIAICSYEKGKRNGNSTAFYPGGKLMEKRFFVNGKKDGVHAGYYADGNKKFEYHFKNDEFNGTCMEWYETGNLYRRSHYVNGHEEGLQQVWNRDASLYANYEARNGRKYGLTGTKHCMNDTTSITLF